VSAEQSPWIRLSAGGFRWRVRPECRERLFGPDGLRLAEWLHGGLAQIVKQGPHRTVYRVALPGLQFYVKHFRMMDLRAWLRQLVRPAKARMECDRALAVAAKFVPTITPLGLGERWTATGPGESFLVTRTLEDVEPLNAFLEMTLPALPPARQATVRTGVAEELGALVARMHAGGILHHDLHAGNLLIGLEADDQVRLYLIDLHAVHLGRPLDWPARRDNLVLLNRWFVLRASRADRLRFWRAYWRAWGDPPDGTLTFRDQALDLEQLTWASNLRFWQHRDRRSLDSNRYYQRVRSATVRGHVVRDLDQAVLAGLLADPDEPFRRSGSRWLKDSPSSSVIELEVAVNGMPYTAVYKRFRVTTWTDPWTALVRRSPALRSWILGHGLRERCLPTARPLAVLHRYRHGLCQEGYLLTVKIADAVDLHASLRRLDDLTCAERQAVLRQRIHQVADLVRDIHRRRLSHRDLKAANLLVQGAHGTDAGAVWLIDLVGVRCQEKLSWRRRVQNLARLHASFLDSSDLTRTDRLRFLRDYLQWGLFGRAGWKRWWKAIHEAARRKAIRNARNGRPLS
jgi:tRNA A-37 threonylcarbamoyl transferase component Bud32